MQDGLKQEAMERGVRYKMHSGNVYIEVWHDGDQELHVRVSDGHLKIFPVMANQVDIMRGVFGKK